MQEQELGQQQCPKSPRNILFDKYEMGRLLGLGTFAKVYHGRNLITNESVAIKVMNKDHIKNEGLMEQIQREICIMHLVRHPHIVELKEVMATKTKIFFLMEHVTGGELFNKVFEGKLKEDVARKYFRIVSVTRASLERRSQRLYENNDSLCQRVKFNKKGYGNFGGTVARMDESLSNVISELALKNEKDTLRTSHPYQHEVKLNEEHGNMFDMGCDGGQLDPGNTKPPKSRQDK
ncbi:PREDICTED: CBL-interacting serine/threonine-protein kinase 12-like [Prunus mume]|uniref:CBL-interacting serine/threonine-protein kinase 12-like n=1 Tax=Prunus mume TaxID=102107 RepID=A0ABM0NS26_PRUMU|nr:PREDICTED: CBL-interacting serine/threonine-protein kinase 12-like [Prunus mume]